MAPADIDAIVFATLSPEYLFPGSGVLLQAKLGVPSIPCLDIRNQCSGFIYGLSVADAWIKTGQYKRVLLVGAEVHSAGLDLTTRGRDLAVLFGDGAGAVILGPTEEPGRGVLSTHLFADGTQAKLLLLDVGGTAHTPRISHELIDQGLHHPVMKGHETFIYASKLMPDSVRVALEANGLALDDIRLLISHQANLRILEMVQKRLGLRDDQVHNNVQRYGNTTAASIPIALHEALDLGRLARGDLLILTAFGGGLTWASAAIRW
jgi:3-oxoacyl-[acyl-carrier-protein] synthase-3